MPSSALPIGIIGAACRLPGGVRHPLDLAAFLRSGGDGIIDVPPDRWDVELHYDADDRRGRAYVRRGGFLHDDPKRFDPAPFGLSPRDADAMDPQQRLMLETSWEAIEDADLPIEALRGTATGVYIGGFMGDVNALVAHPGGRHKVSQHTATGSTMTLLSNRISYVFDLRGPSMTVDTACSSSMVAAHLACQAIHEGACERALIGGVTMMLSPHSPMMMSKGRFLAKDGHSKSFEADADGYGRAEGAVMLLVEPLHVALAAGRRVLAVIRGTGINQDGRTDGIALPSGEAQARLSREVCARAGVNPVEVGLIEAHGTGTRVGDPIETRALGEVYGVGRPADKPLYIGSVKSNIGHTEAAAGLAGMLKAALSLGADEILPQRPLRAANPDIPFDALRLKVVEAPTPWPAGRRLAAISSFGYGGTNAIALLEAAPTAPTRAELEAPADALRLLAVSADSTSGLRARAGQLLEVLAGPEADVDRLAATLAHNRSLRPERGVLTVSGLDDARAALTALRDGAPDERVHLGRASTRRPLVWVFTGMGPQWPGMGQQLLDQGGAFAETVTRAAETFDRLSGRSILDEWRQSATTGQMARNDLAQPTNLLLQLGLIAQLHARGLRPDAILGHSVGEVAAAYAAGALSLEQAVEVAFHRSSLQQEVAGRGGMLAAAMDLDELHRFVPEGADVAVAAINAPGSVALAGSAADLDRVERALTEAGRFAKRMTVEVAYHSPHMDTLQDGFFARLGHLTPAAPTLPLYSTLTGARVEGAAHDAAYWWGNARQPVRLRDAVRAALGDGMELFLEIGPHPVLGAAIKANAAAAGRSALSLFTLKRQTDEPRALARAVAQALAAGAEVNRAQLAPARAPLRLPTYPFQRAHHWMESRASQDERLGAPGAHPMLRRPSARLTPSWRCELAGAPLAWTSDHVVAGQTVLPAAAQLEMMLAAAATQGAATVREVRLSRALVIDHDGINTLTLDLGEGGELVLTGVTDDEAPVELTRAILGGAAGTAPRQDLPSLTAQMPLSAPTGLYERLTTMGLQYGPAFQTVRRIGRAGRRLLVELVPQVELGRFFLHPTLLDGAFHAMLSLLPDEVTQPVIPTSLASLRLFRPARGALYALVDSAPMAPDGSIRADLRLYDITGEAVAALRGLECRPIRPALEGLTAEEKDWAYVETTTPVPAREAPPAAWAAWVDDAQLRATLAEGALARGESLTLLDETGPLTASPSRIVLQVDPGEQVDGSDGLLGLLERVRCAQRRLPGVALRLITLGAIPSPASAGADLGAAAQLGLARTLQNEQPELDLRLLDLPQDAQPEGSTLLEILHRDDEEELIWRPEGLSARRVSRLNLDQIAHPGRVTPTALLDAPPAELVVGTPGDLSTLAFRPVPSPSAGPGELLVRMERVALNLKDVAKALGRLHTEHSDGTYTGAALGLEGVGVIVAAGDGIDPARVGERVRLMTGGALATVVRVRAHEVLPLGDRAATEAACDFVHMTAWHSLLHVAQLQPGERVLIHQAGGGVGLAATQLALGLGAEVVALAGTEAKRAALRAIGARWVFNSRDPAWAEAVREALGEPCLDVVLASSDLPFMREALGLLRPLGRYVELGKSELVADKRLALGVFNRSITFAAVDLDRLGAAKPETIVLLNAAVAEALQSGRIAPLPVEVFTGDRVGEAMRRLGSGEVLGKVVVDLTQGALPVLDVPTPPAPVRADRGYLITGGLGGFGLRSARWLVDQGARHVVLASRRGVAEDPAAVESLRARGAVIVEVALDVVDLGAVSALVARFGAEWPPLAGVIHAAMVLHDAPALTLDRPSLRHVLRPKVDGAWNLHVATEGLPLEHFIVYSSISGWLGNPNQGAYAAANAAMEALVYTRRAAGLPGSVVAWGAIGSVGVVARAQGTERHLNSIGLSPISPGRALHLMGYAQRLGVVSLCAASAR
ncbi:SDR family NAD(P)-dependent oxidoreductase, partial [Myxococcota bacterium]|nr:SDR family NAD(P)-dependent oxidoreductase [Myxococcota bacterium]